MVMPQEVEVNNTKDSFSNQNNYVAQLPRVYGNGIYCEQTECIYCLNSRYCCRASNPRNKDGYCKDFISIND